MSSLASLESPLRRRIYGFVRDQGRPVTRDEVAKETGISRRLAAFHLDTLLERGLLRSHYARPPGRTGPGAGRSSKMYEPSDLEIEVSLPERRYDLAGKLLVEAISAEGPGEPAKDAALRVAHREGVTTGEEVARREGLRHPGPERTLSVAREALADLGYEPYGDTRTKVALRNCPFHSLAKQAPELMCTMNQAFVDGLLRGMGNDSVRSVLACEPGDCCVTLNAPGADRA
ncbi:MAG: helix-turn-helix transcriptional regulator [Gemmatimonadota bacterium]